MGWDFGWDSRQSLIEHNTKSHYHLNGDYYECIDWASPAGVLWSVWEVTTPIHKYRWIACDLIKYMKDSDFRVGPWGYKGMDESMHPYTYNCPLKFLEMVKPEPPDRFNLEWRKKVYEYWEEKQEKRGVKKAVKIGDTLILKNSTIPEVYVISVKPLIGIWAGRKYKIPPRFIDRIGVTDYEFQKELA